MDKYHYPPTKVVENGGFFLLPLLLKWVSQIILLQNSFFLILTFRPNRKFSVGKCLSNFFQISFNDQSRGRGNFKIFPQIWPIAHTLWLQKMKIDYWLDNWPTFPRSNSRVNILKIKNKSVLKNWIFQPKSPNSHDHSRIFLPNHFPKNRLINNDERT